MSLSWGNPQGPSRLEGVATPRLQSIGLVWELLALPSHTFPGSGPLVYWSLISHGSWGGRYVSSLELSNVVTVHSRRLVHLLCSSVSLL